ncbi:hypothetical protein QCA50_008090 [Cerrena zonata]|uniref:Uncharacterized protein n=1 Tax=Cerrena zonata TaxID=2478898 RepID=A0AAW0G7Z9_9APHY
MDYSTDTFAFKRIPVSPDATQWDKQEGSPEPRYHATELSVIFDPNAHMEFTGPMHDHFYNFFLLADQFPALEVLRLITRVETPEDEHFQFEEYMFQIGNRLKSWARLRKLIMCFRVEGEWFHWDSTLNTKTQSILDSPLPPSEQDLDWISNDELARLCDDPDLATTCVDSLAAQTPVDDPVAESDIIDRLMRIWRLRNGERMEKVMNNLWKCCPTLRQVDWYPWNTDVSDDYGVETLCRWSYVPQVNAGITEDGQDPHQVVWDLLWKGCPEGDPDPLMTIRVGQEWERELDILSM